MVQPYVPMSSTDESAKEAMDRYARHLMENLQIVSGAVDELEDRLGSLEDHVAKRLAADTVKASSDRAMAAVVITFILCVAGTICFIAWLALGR